MKSVVVRPAAAADIEDAHRWYEKQRPGLGVEFLKALRETMDAVREHPTVFQVVHRETRRALVRRRFPYGIFYRLHGDLIIVVACMHVRRSPRRWKDRPRS